MARKAFTGSQRWQNVNAVEVDLNAPLSRSDTSTVCDPAEPAKSDSACLGPLHKSAYNHRRARLDDFYSPRGVLVQ